MNREFKKTFFISLLAVLLVISNIIGLKLTNFMDITISVNFITFPFTFLCTLLIMNLGDKKDAYRAILVSSIIQLLMPISYVVATNLGTQTLMPDSSTYVNGLFQVNEMNILGYVLAFILSHCLLIYIYDNFKQYQKELYGLVIGLLGSMFLNSVIYLLISLREYEIIFIVNMLLSNIIISIIMLIIIIILFYILKERDVEIIKIKESSIKKDKDLSIDEVMQDEIIKKVNKKVSSNKKTSSKTSNKTSNTKPRTVKKSKAVK